MPSIVELCAQQAPLERWRQEKQGDEKQSDETLVLLVSIRGRSSGVELVSGLGGIAPGSLLTFDLEPRDKTYLWQQLAELLEALSGVARECNPARRLSARLLLFDLSQSMASQEAVLRQMWAAVPSDGLRVQNLEVMVVTDGEDNESDAPYAGSGGLLALLRRAMQLGWDCGQGADRAEQALIDGEIQDVQGGQGAPRELGKLHVTLLDVGDGSVARELADRLAAEEPLASAALLCTRDVDLVARVVRGARPALRGRVAEDQIAAHWPPLSAEAAAQVAAVARHLHPKKRAALDLAALLAAALGPAPTAAARAAVLDFLAALLIGGEQRQVDRRGVHKAHHSGINALLYQLKAFGIVQHTDGTPRLWSRDVMHAFALDQLEALLAAPAPTPAPAQVDVDALLEHWDEAQVDALVADPQEAAALCKSLLRRLHSDHASKRQKTE